MAGTYSNPNYQQEYQRQYWLDTLADENRHQKLLKRRREWYKRRILRQ